jgi:hypothetical protein
MGGSSKGAADLIAQVGTLFSGFNQLPEKDGEIRDGILSLPEKELSLKLSDDELIQLKNKWEQAYKRYESPIVKRQKSNKDYWLGEQYGYKNELYSLVDNIIFESVETLLPLISRQNPVPVVMTDNTEEGIELADNTAKMLQYLADEEKLKIKLKQATRHWCLDLIGVLKVGWDFIQDDMRIMVVKPENLILDPVGTFDGGEFRGRYIGEKKRDDAKTLIRRFPDKEEEITMLVKGELGTELGYTEWWTDEFVFWTIGNLVLDKRENPHWNYESEQVRIDEYGAEISEQIPGNNHFETPKKPYSFIWVFNNGAQPHDITSLIEQASSLQDAVNKRNRQIDRNADDTNNGWIFSNQFDQNSGKQALDALRKGLAIIAPTTSIGESVQRLQAPPLASYIYEDLLDKRNQIRNIMGVRGSTAQGIMSERTVRGKIEIKGQDVDRLGLIVEHIEQCIDFLFNYMVQMMYVYYNEPHVAALIGNEKAVEYIQIRNTDFNRDLIVSIKEGSMIPQDPLMRRNEAIDLWGAGALDPVTLFERLDFPNPREAAEKLITYSTNPMGLMGGGMPAEAQIPPETTPEPQGGLTEGLPPLPPV